jgi:hypothetical protein
MLILSIRYDILIALVLALGGWAFLVGRLSKRRLPYPPGPRRLPIVGNLCNMPSREECQWVTFKKWSKDFGTGRPLAVYARRVCHLCLLVLNLVQDLTLYMSMYWDPILLSSTRSNQQMNCLRSDLLFILIGMSVTVIMSTSLNECASQATYEGIGAVRLSNMG